MTYKKTRTKKKYVFTCDKCGQTQERSRDVPPKECNNCERIAQVKENQRLNDLRNEQVLNFKKENNFGEAKSCDSCKKSLGSSNYEYDDIQCTGAGYAENGKEIVINVWTSNVCDAFEHE